LSWNDAEILNSLKGYQEYLNDFPLGKYAAEAKKRLSK
jgi:outer membrane protein assembly factor BamD (BamD/ComL family)